jgi:transposase
VRVSLICQLIIASVNGCNPKRYVISIDEKTGIQALGRIEQVAPASKGGHIRREFEYQRNGTTTLIAGLNMADGKLINSVMGPTRTELDFHNFIKETIDDVQSKEADAEIVFMTDHLNIHISESLVKLMASLNNVSTDLGLKDKKGILQNQITRKKFLETENHKIRFLFTPKHCSWLNPIENWFAKLQKHVITNGNFISVEELENKITKYVDYHNEFLCKKMKWKFKGFEKEKELANIKPLKN